MSTNIPYSWSWDFGDGNTSIAQNPTHTYTVDGTYDVKLIATNVFGSDTIEKTAYIVVATANATVTPSCEPQTLGTLLWIRNLQRDIGCHG